MSIFKRILVLLLAILMLASIVACSPVQSGEKQDDNDPDGDGRLALDSVLVYYSSDFAGMERERDLISTFTEQERNTEFIGFDALREYGVLTYAFSGTISVKYRGNDIDTFEKFANQQHLFAFNYSVYLTFNSDCQTNLNDQCDTLIEHRLCDHTREAMKTDSQNHKASLLIYPEMAKLKDGIRLTDRDSFTVKEGVQAWGNLYYQFFYADKCVFTAVSCSSLDSEIIDRIIDCIVSSYTD